MKKYLIVAFLLLPTASFAAGFAKQSLFLSKTPVTEGESVLIHAVVSNDAAAKFTGTVVFKDGTAIIGTVATAIAAGGASAVSISWKPSAGSHEITAELTSSDTVVVEQESATFTVAEKPKPVVVTSSKPLQTAATVESSKPIHDTIAKYSPAVADGTDPLFAALDSFRSSAANFIDGQITSTKQNLAKTSKPGLVLGNASTTPKIPDAAGSFWFVLYTIYLYILTLLRFVIGNVGIFYPALALLFFYFLWKTYKRFRRPAWER